LDDWWRGLWQRIRSVSSRSPGRTSQHEKREEQSATHCQPAGGSAAMHARLP